MKLSPYARSLAVRAAAACAALAVCAGPAAAQGAPVAGAARPAAPAAPRAAAPIPKPVIAFIDSNVFEDQVGEIKVAVDRLKAQFDAQNKEVQALVDRMTALEAQAKQGTATREQTEQMEAQFAQLKREYERKGQDLQQAKQRAFDSAMGPIRTKMTAALKQFAQQRGITLVFELNVLQQSGQIFYVADGADITRAFVEEYNKANPAR